MIGVSVCDHRALNRQPGVDKKPPLLAEKAGICHAEQWVSVQTHVIIIGTALEPAISMGSNKRDDRRKLIPGPAPGVVRFLWAE